MCLMLPLQCGGPKDLYAGPDYDIIPGRLHGRTGAKKCGVRSSKLDADQGVIGRADRALGFKEMKWAYRS
jgi:hypothetical protein